MLWIIVLQQPLAKSVHPFHVKSWERHGADEDMVETLKHFAAFCGQSAQALAEEIRAMSPAVKKRFEEGSSKSWLKAWEDEVGEREKQHAGGAVNEATYFLRGFLVGTGSLESRFIQGRQSAQATSWCCSFPLFMVLWFFPAHCTHPSQPANTHQSCPSCPPALPETASLSRTWCRTGFEMVPYLVQC